MFPTDAKGVIWENWPLDRVCTCSVCVCWVLVKSIVDSRKVR